VTCQQLLLLQLSVLTSPNSFYPDITISFKYSYCLDLLAHKLFDSDQLNQLKNSADECYILICFENRLLKSHMESY